MNITALSKLFYKLAVQHNIFLTNFDDDHASIMTNAAKDSNDITDVLLDFINNYKENYEKAVEDLENGEVHDESINEWAQRHNESIIARVIANFDNMRDLFNCLGPTQGDSTVAIFTAARQFSMDSIVGTDQTPHFDFLIQETEKFPWLDVAPLIQIVQEEEQNPGPLLTQLRNDIRQILEISVSILEELVAQKDKVKIIEQAIEKVDTNFGKLIDSIEDKFRQFESGNNSEEEQLRQFMDLEDQDDSAELEKMRRGEYF